MVLVYFDSSAFVKLLVEEEGSELAASLWDGCDAATKSRVWPEYRYPKRQVVGTTRKAMNPGWRLSLSKSPG